MSISKETVQKLAQLSRLELSDEVQTKMQEDLGDILSWVEKLEEVDTRNVRPLTNVNEEPVHMRDDTADNYFSDQEALNNAPQKDDNYFVVPKVLS